MDLQIFEVANTEGSFYLPPPEVPLKGVRVKCFNLSEMVLVRGFEVAGFNSWDKFSIRLPGVSLGTEVKQCLSF